MLSSYIVLCSEPNSPFLGLGPPKEIGNYKTIELPDNTSTSNSNKLNNNSPNIVGSVAIEVLISSESIATSGNVTPSLLISPKESPFASPFPMEVT